MMEQFLKEMMKMIQIANKGIAAVVGDGKLTLLGVYKHG